MLQNKRKTAYFFSIIITALAAFASAGGIIIHGLYRDNLWIKSLWYGNDLATLFIAVPLMTAALILTIRGSLRAQLAWLGLLYYMFYNYFYYLFGSVFNRFFLIYVAIFMLSLFALVLGLMSIDFEGIKENFMTRTPVRWVSGYMLFFASALGGMWIVLSLIFAFTGKLPESLVDSEPTARLIFAADLTLMVPYFVLGSIWLWKYRAWGYILGSILNVGIANYGLALTVGSITQYRAGVPGALTMVPAWCFTTIGCTVASLFMLRNIIPTEKMEVSINNSRE